MGYQAGAGLILAAGVIWSTQGLGIRMIEQAESWSVLAWRSVGLILAVGAYLAVTPRRGSVANILSVGRSGVIGAFSLVLAFGGAIYAMQATSIASAVVLFSASPFFAALIGWAFAGQRVPASTWAAIFLASLGIAVMVGGEIDMQAAWGNLAALISAFGFGLFSVSLSSAGQNSDASKFPILLLAGVFSAFVGWMAALAVGQDLTPPARDIGLAIGMGAITLAGGMLLFTIGTRTVPAAAATLLAQLEVILGPFWVWLVLGEALTRATAIGGMIVLAALALNVLAARPKRAAPPAIIT